jgi:hypothetical protein
MPAVRATYRKGRCDRAETEMAIVRQRHGSTTRDLNGG